ncbi:hypothetical protein [Peloplasma aerotolerans]|uniref:YwaF family protein n=1 Tax=Peloplasma aerotolerans TaxID=3044389 RepID=A0AAW6UB03_9MOLU|nr:hypothetical protein [Mariniplasma sp. M4Ah]MDI6452859.1 hypothetical protein [Mariniplasma sp. M4Ah]
MRIIKFGNFYYFAYIIIAFLLVLLTIRFLKNKPNRYKHYFLFSIYLVAFVIHFLKVFIYPYNTLNIVYHKMTLENVSAVSTVFFPWIYLSKNKVLKDYLVIGGISSGILPFLFPIDAMIPMFDGNYLPIKHALSLEVIRFYFAHLVLLLVPIVMMHYKMHRISVKRILYMPVILMVILTILFINEWAITQIGWVSSTDFLNPLKRNPSLIFGLKDGLSGLGVFIALFVPKVFTIHPVTGALFYWPVVWLIFPVFIYGTIISFIYALIYDREESIKII